jgi:protein-tyrosine phosphatase
VTSQPQASLLPPRRDARGPYRVALVCLGNICRSPMAEVVLSARLEHAGLERHVEVASAGTGHWHVGGPMDRRAAATLTAHGYDASAHRAQQATPRWLDDHDLVLAMDGSNHEDLADALGDEQQERLLLFRDFDPRAARGDRDVPDPYYGGDDGFDHVLALVERTADALVAALEEHVSHAGSEHGAGTEDTGG